MNEKLQKPSVQTPVINVAGVCKSFGSQVVLKDISFQLTAGQGFCICGANAAGKTTLVRIMAGLLQADEGAVEICGFNVREQRQKTKPMLGAIFHNSMVYPQLTVMENLRFFTKLYGVKDSKAHIQNLLQLTGLTPYRYDKAGLLSRGMLQRLAIARALVHKPTVLLADEPFAGLDVEASKHLVTIISNFKDEGGTVVVTTANAGSAVKCCQQVAVLIDHKLILNSNISDIDNVEFMQEHLSYTRGKH
jgi:heme ABC exporter ATP-binding subunit CcmA